MELRPILRCDEHCRRGGRGGQPKGCATVSGAHIGVRGLWLRLGLFAAVWARRVKDDLRRLVRIFLGIEFAVDRGKSAEELIGDVGEDGGAAGRDFVFGEEEEEAGEEGVDGDGGAEFLEVGGEGGGGVGGFALVLLEPGVIGAIRGVRVEGEQAATHTVGEAMRAASGVIDEAGFSSLRGHILFPFEVNWGTPPGVLYGCENKGVAGKGICKSMKTKGKQKWVVSSG